MVKRSSAIVLAAGAMLAAGLLGPQSPSAEARPPYLEAFGDQYEHLAEKTSNVKCGVCHSGTSKKDRNDYGKALADALGTKNQKDMSLVKEAFAKVEKQSSNVEGQTWGDVLKENLPK